MRQKTARSMALGVVVSVLAFCLQAGGEEPQYHAMPARLVNARDGLGHVLTKLQQGGPVRIGYLGGSITAAPGWRIQTREWFASQFPQADVSEIHAAIGGTGSDLGVFRLQHDALEYKPDLLFVEFAVNDGGAPPQRIWQAMEGIVRQTWAANPLTDICFIYTYRVGYEAELSAGNCPRAASAMEMLADHYGIPSINVALKVVQLEEAGELIFKADAPPEDARLHFSRDGVHPLEAGHRIYTQVIADAIVGMMSQSPAVDNARKLKTPFVSSHWQAAKMVPLSKAMLSGDWKQLDDGHRLSRSFSGRMGTLWEAKEPGSRIAFRFRGSQAKLYDLLGPDGGQVTISVDGVWGPKPIPRFDSYCTYHRIATLSVASGLDPNAVHSVIVQVHPEQPDRNPVAFRLKDPESELKSDKYQGTNVRVSQIMLLGELVE